VSADLPDFHISLREKIDWMVETNGWAIEPVAANVEVDPPLAGYVYTIGFPERFQFPEVVVFGLQPVAARGLFDLLAELLDGGTEIPFGIELTGLFDNDLRCVFAPVDMTEHGELFTTAAGWRRSTDFEVVQLLWPDRNGFLPTESGFDRRVVHAQPVIGRC
jgi:hypothetical protein